jgi:hypothetical protein
MAIRPYNIHKNIYCFRCIFGAMDSDAIALCVGYKLIEIVIELLDHISADGVCLLAAFLPIGQGFERSDASLDAAFGVGV